MKTLPLLPDDKNAVVFPFLWHSSSSGSIACSGTAVVAVV